jgi:hypothetical protein
MRHRGHLEPVTCFVDVPPAKMLQCNGLTPGSNDWLSTLQILAKKLRTLSTVVSGPYQRIISQRINDPKGSE